MKTNDPDASDHGTRAHNRKFNDSLEHEIGRRYRGGASTEALAKESGVSSVTIKNILKRLGIPRRSLSEARRLALKMGRSISTRRAIKRQGSRLSPEKAYVFGSLCGDASLSPKAKNGRLVSATLQLMAMDQAFVRRFQRCVIHTYGTSFVCRLRRQRIKGSPKGFGWRTAATSIAIHDDLQRDFHGKHRSADWLVPESVIRASIEARSAFLRAFFDGEATVARHSIVAGSRSHRGLYGVWRLLDAMGVRAHLTASPRRTGPFWLLTLCDRASLARYAAEVGFTIPRKRETLARVMSSYRRTSAYRLGAPRVDVPSEAGSGPGVPLP